MSEQQQEQHVYRVNQFRKFVVWLIVLALFGVLVGRLLWIQVLHPEHLVAEGNARVVRNYDYEPARGLITDRFGKILAISVPVKSVAADPKTLHEHGIVNDDEKIAKICELLELKKDEFLSKISDPTRQYVPLKRYLEVEKARELRDVAGDGMLINDSYRRYYPAGESCAQLVGILNQEGNGIYGVEQSFNSYLSAQPGRMVAHKDRYDHVIENIGVLSEGMVGGNLMLSIDSRLQTYAHGVLSEAVRQHKADSGTATLIDVKTGEILAIVSAPSFDPNERTSFKSKNAQNRAVTDLFEPGSTLKPLVALAGLENGSVTWNEVFDTRPFSVDGKLIKDSHFMDRGDLTEIIKYSSNTGMARISQRLGPHKIMHLLKSFGFGVRTESGLTGEHSGRLNENRRFWADIDTATLGFGYGVAVTNVQLTSAYATIAAGGARLPVSILRIKTPPQALQVASAHEVKRMQAALKHVVAEGTGGKAAISRYQVAGKTGTAKIATAHGYSQDYTATFVGFAPRSNPRFALAVVITAPNGKQYYGGSVSGPVFSDIMAQALQLYNVAPDAETDEKK